MVFGDRSDKFVKLVEGYSDKNYPLMSLILLFDEPKLQDEFLQVPVSLSSIVWYAAAISSGEFGTPLVITHIFRTHAEQDAIYKNDPKYNKAPFVSVHQYSRGVDARLHDMGVENAKKLAEKVNKKFPYGGGKSTVLVHDVGQGNHIHFQIPS